MMKNDHIIDLLDSQGLARLSEEDLSRIRAHAGACQECLRAYHAARVGATLLNRRAALVTEPPPFFETRIMAGIRQKGAEERGFGFSRLWQSARAVVYSMALVAMVLMVLNFSIPDTAGGNSDSANLYLADNTAILLYEPDVTDPEEMSYSQVMSDLYREDFERSEENGADK